MTLADTPFEPEIQINGDALRTVESLLGRSIPVAHLARELGVPSHCTNVWIDESGESEILLGAISTETNFQLALILGEKPWDGVRPSYRYCQIELLFKDKDRDDPRERRLADGLMRRLAPFLTERGFRYVFALCYRSADHNGHLVWARQGFNGRPAQETVRAAQTAFSCRVRTVQQIVRQPEGLRWWATAGGTYFGRYPLYRDRWMSTLGRRPYR